MREAVLMAALLAFTDEPERRDVSDSTSELQRERIGRAVAEARIDQLKDELRRAESAVRALLPDVDADPDSVREAGGPRH